MQSTIQPSDPTPSPAAAAEFLTGYLHRIHVAQSDALAILQRVMIQAARLLDEPEFEKPYQTRSTNERMRIAMRSAATIINMRLPRLAGEPSTPPPPSPPPSPGTAGEGAPRSSEGRMRAPFSSPTPATLTTAAASSPLPAAEPVIASLLLSPPHLSTHDSAPKPPVLSPSPIHAPSFDTFDPFVVKNASPPPLPSSVPPVPLLDKNPPPPPPDLTFEERASIHMRQQGVKVPDLDTIAPKLRAWHLYTEKYGIKPPFNITPESLLPPRPKGKRRTPIHMRQLSNLPSDLTEWTRAEQVAPHSPAAASNQPSDLARVGQVSNLPGNTNDKYAPPTATQNPPLQRPPPLVPSG